MITPMHPITATSMADLYEVTRNRDGLLDEIKVAELMAEYESQVDSLPTIFIGPTWRRNDAGKWDLPEHTLGWEIAGWCAEFIGGPGGKPWRFTKEQLRFLLAWYAIDKSGRFIHRTGVLQRCKGW